MKKLQNNYTTPEQSKRLLELGIPAWTADCFYIRPFGNQIYDKTPNINYNLQNYKEITQRFGQNPDGIQQLLAGQSEG